MGVGSNDVRSRRGIRVIFFALAVSSTVAVADPCADSAMFDPVELSYTNGPIAGARRTCARDELTFGLHALAVIRVEEFYGKLVGAGVLSGGFALDEETELFAALEVVRYQQVIRSLSASNFNLGHLALGGTRRIHTGDRRALAWTAHATLPTALGLYDRTVTFALDTGVSGTTRIDRDLELHGYLGGRGTIGAGAGPAQPKGQLILDAGAAYRIQSWLAIAVDLEGAAGERAVLDHAALGVGLRFAAGDRFRIDVSAKAPLAGDERALASAYAGVAYWD